MYEQDNLEVVVTSLFDGKLDIIQLDYEELLTSGFSGDVLVIFCASNLLSGDFNFIQIHGLAGPELKAFASDHYGLGPGSFTLSDAFNLKNFKKIAHCVLPRPLLNDEQKLDEFVENDLFICYRNLLDSMAENGYNSIVFTHPSFYTADHIVSISLTIFKHWLEMHSARQLETQMKFTILCNGAEGELSTNYVNYARHLCSEGVNNSLELRKYLQATHESNGNAIHKNYPDYDQELDFGDFFDKLFQHEFPNQESDEVVQYNGQKRRQKLQHVGNALKKNKNDRKREQFSNAEKQIPTQIDLNRFCKETYGFEETFIKKYPDTVYEMLFQTAEGFQLQLSRNLSSTILTIEQGTDGLLRQYRMTTQNTTGCTSYFRCSRCESLIISDDDPLRYYRPKLTVRNGFIYGDCYPVHHPRCYPLTKLHVIMQQLERQYRVVNCKENALLPAEDDNYVCGADVIINEDDEPQNTSYLHGCPADGETSQEPLQIDSPKAEFKAGRPSRINMINAPILYHQPQMFLMEGNDTFDAIKRCDEELEGEGVKNDKDPQSHVEHVSSRLEETDHSLEDSQGVNGDPLQIPSNVQCPSERSQINRSNPANPSVPDLNHLYFEAALRRSQRIGAERSTKSSIIRKRPKMDLSQEFEWRKRSS